MIYEIYTENGTKKKRALTGNGYGLPLGTWISYEGTCPDGFIESEQTFNTTTYASLYAMLGTNKVPARFDHSVLSDWESITISTDSNNPTIMDYDGIININCNSSTTMYLNGQLVVTTPSSIFYTREVSFVKGDRIYLLNNVAGNTKVRYYKRHLAIKATPAYVEPDTVSNMVNTLRTQDSYSTSEVNTGKKWIDGKPIYKKTWYSTTNWANNQTVGNIADFDSLVSLHSISRNSAAGRYYDNYTDDTHANCASIDDTTGNVVVNRIGNFVNNSPAWVTIEYTKTTD